MTRADRLFGAPYWLERLAGDDVDARADAALRLASLARARDDVEQAERLLRTASQEPSPSVAPRAAFALGQLLEALGEVAAAAAAFALAAGLSRPEASPDVLCNLAARWAVLGRVDDAIDAYRRVVAAGMSAEQEAHRQDAAVAAFRLGELLDETGRHDEAMAAWRLALASRSPEAAPHAAMNVYYGILASGTADHAELDALLRRAIELDHPDRSPEAGLALAERLLARGELEGGYELLELVADCEHPEHSPTAQARLHALTTEHTRNYVALALQRLYRSEADRPSTRLPQGGTFWIRYSSLRPVTRTPAELHGRAARDFARKLKEHRRTVLPLAGLTVLPRTPIASGELGLTPLQGLGRTDRATPRVSCLLSVSLSALSAAAAMPIVARIDVGSHRRDAGWDMSAVWEHLCEDVFDEPRRDEPTSLLARLDAGRPAYEHPWAGPDWERTIAVMFERLGASSRRGRSHEPPTPCGCSHERRHEDGDDDPSRVRSHALHVWLCARSSIGQLAASDRGQRTTALPWLLDCGVVRRRHDTSDMRHALVALQLLSSLSMRSLADDEREEEGLVLPYGPLRA